MTAAIAAFAMTYLCMAGRPLPFLPIGRPAAALVGAVAMVVAGVLTLEQAFAAIEGAAAGARDAAPAGERAALGLFVVLAFAGFSLAAAAMTGAAILVVIAGQPPRPILERIDWSPASPSSWSRSTGFPPCRTLRGATSSSRWPRPWPAT